jgi:hypothetical protein
MGSSQRQRAIRAMRGAMRSPGRPPGWLWRAIAGGLSSEDAAAVARGGIRGRHPVVP